MGRSELTRCVSSNNSLIITFAMSPNSRIHAPQQREPSRFQVAMAFVTLVLLGLVLRIGRFPALYRVVSTWPTQRKPYCSRRSDAHHICSSLDRASVWLPSRTLCLLHSASLVVLLRSHAIAAELVIGIQPRPFEGHAWVESNGKVLGPPLDQGLFRVIDRF